MRPVLFTAREIDFHLIVVEPDLQHIELIRITLVFPNNAAERVVFVTFGGVTHL